MKNIDDIRQLIGGEWQDFVRAFSDTLNSSDNALLRDVAEYLLQRQGKQLRPLLVLKPLAITDQVMGYWRLMPPLPSLSVS